MDTETNNQTPQVTQLSGIYPRKQLNLQPVSADIEKATIPTRVVPVREADQTVTATPETSAVPNPLNTTTLPLQPVGTLAQPGVGPQLVQPTDNYGRPIREPIELPEVSFLPGANGWLNSILVRLLMGLFVGAAIYVYSQFTEYVLSINQGLALVALTVIASMYFWSLERVFRKAGEPPRKAWLPYYNLITLYRLSGVSPKWLWIDVAAAGFLAATGKLPQIVQLILLPVYFLLFLALLVGIAVRIFTLFKLAKCFGKSILFGFLMLTPLGYMILGFDSSKYAVPVKSV